MKSFNFLVFFVLLGFLNNVHADDVLQVQTDEQKAQFWGQEGIYPEDKTLDRYFYLREKVIRPYVIENLATLPVNSAMTELWAGKSGIRFALNGHMYTMFANTFMHKTKPDEVCSWLKAEKNGLPNYQCPEGQPLHFDCNFYFVNDDIQIKAVHIAKLSIPESSRPPFCQTVLGVGAANKTAPALMVTVQYFNTESPVAKTASQLGSNWLRSTLLFRLQEKDGELVVTQDDSCLGNPNKFETIPDARKAFKQRGCK
ncbi:hypothetical protein [Methylovorus glucosotrophus]|uniref:Uncharacterized protein n=1 Tax=Methylovorus glucosotrophus (strain SIP3-4) TaxID=582744 RepID=C6X814_METGS|nr:hypothetical protein [Methylovorus glucosotrophus]ACT51341.1 hypothetical protein Msip34_2099 [Methylovorus glucosotrophus SIP3-4]